MTASGNVTASSCKKSGVKTRTLSRDEFSRLNQWRDAFGTLTVTSKDEATADAMTRTLTLSGKGKGQASEAQRRELLDWAQNVYEQTTR